MKVREKGNPSVTAPQLPRKARGTDRLLADAPSQSPLNAQAYKMQQNTDLNTIMGAVVLPALVL